MARKCITSCLVAWAWVLLAGLSASAQGLSDMQLFAPANLSNYGNGPQANEGFFFAFDGLMWSISAPNVTTIGQPSAQGREVDYADPLGNVYQAIQNNSHDTSIFDSEVVTGQRYEIGFVHNHKGLLFSAWRLNSQTQTEFADSLEMVFDDRELPGGDRHLWGPIYIPEVGDPVMGDLPVTFASAMIRNRVQTWGVELDYLCRTKPTHSGGYFEFFAGARYLEFDDRFLLQAYGERISEGDDDDDDDLIEGTLADSYWRQDAKNHIVGPQLGARWFKRYGRWVLSTEGKFMAGYNTQTTEQIGLVGSELDPSEGNLNEPAAMGPTRFTHRHTNDEWSPCVEFRVGLDWQATKSISIGAGYTAMWIDGITRASNTINYEFGTASTMGILADKSTEDVFMNGANFRIVVNR